MGGVGLPARWAHRGVRIRVYLRPRNVPTVFLYGPIPVVQHVYMFNICMCDVHKGGDGPIFVF